MTFVSTDFDLCMFSFTSFHFIDFSKVNIIRLVLDAAFSGYQRLFQSYAGRNSLNRLLFIRLAHELEDGC